MKTIYLLWTLLAGNPQDVDSFLDEALCLRAKEQNVELLARARSMKSEVPDYQFFGCVPVEVLVPKVEPRKESM